jgi:anti-sigma regulatory factor (Ser/Thr protein kinase)/CheY-like chemotaxis protein
VAEERLIRPGTTRLGFARSLQRSAKASAERTFMKRILAIHDGSAPDWTSGHSLPYELEQACGSCDALERLSRRAFDVLVTSASTRVEEDLALIEVTQELRPGLKAIILAPSLRPPDVISALRARVFGCLTMPFESAEVVEMVKAAAEAVDWRDGIQLRSARPEWISLRVTSSLLTADRLVSFMTALRADVPESTRDDLLIAFREVLLNAMEHGAGFDPEKVVDVSAVRTERAVVYHFRDPGPGFDVARLGHAAVANPMTNPLEHLERRAAEGRRPGGFGILLVRKLVDEVIYNETGNEVVLIKRLQP